MAKELNGYELSRDWWNWSFENPELISPNHSALYFFIIEHCNRLGWKEKFGLPTSMAKDAIGIKSYNTYVKTLNDLTAWGFIKMVERSKNQYSANIVALLKNDKAHTKALDKATIKHVTKQPPKQSESTYQSTCESNSTVDKPLTKNQEPLTNKPINQEPEAILIFPFDTENFRFQWGLWKKYKKDQHNFSYKGDISEQAALKKIGELARDELDAVAILHEAISNGWKGFFKNKDNAGTTKYKTSERSSISDLAAAVLQRHPDIEQRQGY